MAYTKSTYRLFRFQCDATYNAAGTVTSVPTQAFFKSRFTNDSDPNDEVEHPVITQLGFDLIQSPATQITAAGATVTRLQLAALIRKDAETRFGL
jgi:hypothetical protein